VYGPSTDVWALGVIGFERLYGIPDPPTVPTPRRKEKEVQPDQWHHWIDTWARSLLDKLEDEDCDPTVEILLGMIETRPKRRWPADRCLRKGFENGLFRRRAADGLVVNARDPTEAASEAVERDEEARTPTAALPPQTQAGIYPGATIILESLWGSGEAATSPSSRIEGPHSGPLTPA